MHHASFFGENMDRAEFSLVQASEHSSTLLKKCKMSILDFASLHFLFNVKLQQHYLGTCKELKITSCIADIFNFMGRCNLCAVQCTSVHCNPRCNPTAFLLAQKVQRIGSWFAETKGGEHLYGMLYLVLRQWI